MKWKKITTETDLDDALAHIETREHNFAAFDIETDGVREHICNLIGIAFAVDEDFSFYMPTKEWDSEKKTLVNLWEEESYVVNKLCDVLKKRDLIMHNGVFDIAVMYHRFGINLTNSLFCDTILLKHTVDEERPFGLKDLGVKYFGEGEDDEQQELKENVIAKGGKWLKKDKDMYMGDVDILGKYAAKDVNLTITLFDYLSDILEKDGKEELFYEQEVMPLYKKATIPMKLNGVFVDVDYFKELEKEIKKLY